jgi:hypothetical protein
VKVCGLVSAHLTLLEGITLFRFVVFSAVCALAACSSTSGPELRASKPVIHVSSARAASDISSCLQRMIPSAQAVRDQGSTELLVGFEPTVRENRTPDFESGTFDHSATSPSTSYSLVFVGRSMLNEERKYIELFRSFQAPFCN